MMMMMMIIIIIIIIIIIVTVFKESLVNKSMTNCWQVSKPTFLLHGFLILLI
jgi:uncharacterized alpha/beta hydrolase family protein